MKMKRKHTLIAAVACSLIAGSGIHSQDSQFTINSFHGNGKLTLTNVPQSSIVTIQWSDSIDSGRWFSSWQPTTHRENHLSSNMTFQVPMFYRAVIRPLPPSGMVLIDQGHFNMTASLVAYVDPFYIDRYEVSKARWDETYAWAVTNGYTIANTATAFGFDHPVEGLNFFDIIKWCNALSEKHGLTPCYYTDAQKISVYRTSNHSISNDCVKWEATGYRLPTEAEWDMAARGGLDLHHFSWPSYGGNFQDHIDTLKANYLDWGPGNHGDRTRPVGYFNGSQIRTNAQGVVERGNDMANGYGLYDMIGNTDERCWDVRGTLPSGVITNYRGPNSIGGDGRLHKGGDYHNYAQWTPISVRVAGGDYEAWAGFRCVRTP